MRKMKRLRKRLTKLFLFQLQTAANVVQEQAEADEDTSLQQRLLMGGGTALGGASEMTNNDIASGKLGLTSARRFFIIIEVWVTF